MNVKMGALCSMLLIGGIAGSAGLAVAAGEAAAPDSPAQANPQYSDMGHSPGDAKAMRIMPKPGSETQAATRGEKVETTTMGHSVADQKAMRLMKKKHVAKKDQAGVEHSMMGHSPGDAKSMRNMPEPEKTVVVKDREADVGK